MNGERWRVEWQASSLTAGVASNSNSARDSRNTTSGNNTKMIIIKNGELVWREGGGGGYAIISARGRKLDRMFGGQILALK